MNWFKKRSPDDLEAQLRERRTEPRSEFTRSLARMITPEPRWARRRPRHALAGGLCAVGLAAFTVAGGIGAASNAVGGTASVVSAFVPGHDTRSHGQGNNGQGNNGQGNQGQGNNGQGNQGHNPGDDQYGKKCDRWYDLSSCDGNNHGKNDHGKNNHGDNNYGDNNHGNNNHGNNNHGNNNYGNNNYGNNDHGNNITGNNITAKNTR
jgi:hypothetical protein